MSRRIVVGVDPGLRHTGVAIAEEHSTGAIKTVFLVGLMVVDFSEQRMIAQRFATVLQAVFESIEKKYAKSGTLFFPGDKTEGMRWATPRILGFTFHLAIETQNITRGAFKSDQTIQVASALKEGFDMVLFQRYQTRGTVSAHRLVDWWAKTRKGPKLPLKEQRRVRKDMRIARMMEMLHQPLLSTLFGSISEHVADAVLLMCAGCGLKYGETPVPTLLMDLLRYPDAPGLEKDGGIWVHKIDYSVRFAEGAQLLTVCRLLRGETEAALPVPSNSSSGSSSNSSESSPENSLGTWFARYSSPPDSQCASESLGSSGETSDSSSSGGEAEGDTGPRRAKRQRSDS